MAYTHTNFGQMKTFLAERLDDSGKVFWLDTELGLYIIESLRVWQSLTGYWRDRMVFNTAANTAFYDLTSQAGSLIPYTVKDSDLLSIMCYHLLEPQVAGVWSGSDQFTLNDITEALERKRNQFLVETGMVLGRSTLAWPAPPIDRKALADSVIDVRRVAWFDANNNYSTLWRSDEWAGGSFLPGWAQTPSDPPQVFSVAAPPPITLQVIPPPLNNGSVELLTVSTGQTLNPLAGVLLGVPDNFSWVIKWGALADLLSRDGQVTDLSRASYCQSRWEEGINLARIHTSVAQCYINGIQKFVNTVRAFDDFKVGWQNGTAAPEEPALASWNLMAFAPIPDGIYGITCDVVRNAPVPSLNADFIQVGREELDSILDIAQHLASFKMGGAEFMASIALYQRALRVALVYNERLKAAVKFLEPMADRAVKQEEESPRRLPMITQ